MALGDSAGLLFTIKAESTQAEAEIKRFANSLASQAKSAGEEAAAGFGPVGNALTALEGPAAIAALAIAAIGVAALEVTHKLLDMAESASAIGKDFSVFQEKTGMSAEAVSALAYAANLSNKSLSDLQPAILHFTQLMEKSEQGSAKASDTLKRLGVTDFHNLTNAMDQATTTLGKLGPGIDKLNLAADGFGLRGREMLTVLNKMPDGFKAFITEAERLGVTLSQQDIEAAKEFSHAMETVEYQVKLAAANFALQYAPMITDALEEVSHFLADNKKSFVQWGVVVGNAMRGAVDSVHFLEAASTGILENIDRSLSKDGQAWVNWGNVAKFAIASVGFGLFGLAAIGDSMDSRWKIAANWNDGAKLPPAPTPPGGKGGGKGGGAGKDDAQQKELEELRNQIELQKIALSELEDKYKTTLKNIRDEFKKTADSNVFLDAAKTAKDELTAGADKVLDALDALELKAIKDPTDSKIEVVKAQQAKRRADLARKEGEDEITNADDVAKAIKKIQDDLTKHAEETYQQLHESVMQSGYDEIQATVDKNTAILNSESATDAERKAAWQEMTDTIAKNLYFLTAEENNYYENQKLALSDWRDKETKEVNASLTDEEQRSAALEVVNNEYKLRLGLINQIHAAEQKKTVTAGTVPVGPGQQLGTAGKELDKLLQEQFPALVGAGQMLDETFSNVANAVGDAVKSFVLLGSTGTSFRKFAAEVIATIAQMATVQAVFELAQGLAMLALSWFTGNPKYAASAGGHFASAAAFGLIAGVAVGAGRAIAGNAFQDQSAAATGSTTSNSSQHTAGGGGPYSSQPDQTIEQGRNRPSLGPIHIKLDLGMEKDGFLKVIKQAVTTASPLRDAIIEIATNA